MTSKTTDPEGMGRPPSLDKRSGGVFIHIPSLRGPHGCGDLGPAAYRFAEFLSAAGQRWWQILPVCPPGMENSPYNALSAFAGNPPLISLEILEEWGLLPELDVEGSPDGADLIDFEEVRRRKLPHFRKAFEEFERRRDPEDDADFQKFCEEESSWLDDFALYSALRDARGGAGWTSWEADERSRRPEALVRLRGSLAGEIRYHRFLQYIFWRQWERLKEHCSDLGIGLIGDVAFFVAHESAEVWAHPELFTLDGEGRPTEVAGVPPDYFSADGQLWGNPLYRWDEHRRQGFSWWIARLEMVLRWFDAARLDHFIGFHRCWAVPASERTARNGRFVGSPGHDLLWKLKERRGAVPFIAEDLGLITHEVEGLRDRFGFPTMRVLQFGFEKDNESPYHQPHTYPRRCVAYTGTHDNDTLVGWFEGLEGGRDRVFGYLGTHDESSIHWKLIEAVHRSQADLCIIPMQDFLGLGSEARMNRPGIIEGNWRWRLAEGALTDELAAQMRRIAEAHGRAHSGRTVP